MVVPYRDKCRTPMCTAVSSIQLLNFFPLMLLADISDTACLYLFITVTPVYEWGNERTLNNF